MDKSFSFRLVGSTGCEILKQDTVVAWTGQNQATAQKGNSIQLYMTRFDNPQPTKS